MSEYFKLKKVLPKNQYDKSTMSELKKLSKDELTILIPELIVFIKDMSWPIAQDIADLLIPLQEKLVPQIKKILQCDDLYWEYFCLEEIVAKLPSNIIKNLQPDLIRIRDLPYNSEKNEELDMIAANILKKLNDPSC